MVFFYRSTSSIMRKIVNTVPDQTLQRIGKVIDNAKKAKSVVFQSALENPIIFSIFLFWLLAAGLLVFLIGLNFLCRILFAKKGKEISAMSMFWATLSFTVCVVTSVIGIIIYSNSFDHIRAGIEMLPEQLNTTTSDVSDFISNVNDTIMCIYMKQSGKLKHEDGLLFDSIRKNVNKFKDDLNMSHWKNVADLIGLLSRDIEHMDLNSFGYAEKIQTSRMYKYIKVIRNFANHSSSLNSSVAEFRLHVKYIFSKIDNNLKAINNRKKEIFGDIAENVKTFDEIDWTSFFSLAEVTALGSQSPANSQVLQFVNKETVKLQRELADIFTEKRFSQRLHNILGYTLLIPFILVFLSLIGLIGISVSWTFYSNCDRYEYRKSCRGAFSMVVASTLTTAGYTAMFVGALLCLMTAFCFLVACCAMLICMGFFENDDLRLFNAIPNLGYTANFGAQKVRYTLYETFYKCKNGYAFFDSLNGSDVMAAKQLRQGAVFRRHGISRIVRNFHVDRQFKQSISKAIQAFKESNEDLVDISPRISDIRWLSNKHPGKV